MTASNRRVLPGFPLAFGYTTVYLAVLLVIPLIACTYQACKLSPSEFWQVVTNPRVMAAYQVTLGCSFAAAAVNSVLGMLLAWVLVRYHFPGKALFDSLIDLPLALPTAVAGLVYARLYYKTGWLGQFLEPLGIQAYDSQLAIILVLVFIGLPFSVRALQPVIEDLDPQVEEAAASLGADRLQTFLQVILPTLCPALVTGFALSFARGIGEYGSVIFVSGNIRGKTEIAPMLIVERLEAFRYAEASAIAMTLLVFSFLVLMGVNYLERWSKRDAS